MNTGQQGEQLALAYYQNLGYTLAETNYHTRFGEIDLILQKEGLWVFSEVKTRNYHAIAHPSEWVDGKKQAKIRTTALAYLQKHHLGDVPMRFDVVEVWMEKAKKTKINCIENAF